MRDIVVAAMMTSEVEEPGRMNSAPKEYPKIMTPQELSSSRGGR
eukprot:CAMPEP_0202355936 /NCGR_PEP_ID=MMETSP1126-20121109/10617_1 /ASSEMBLY_ACC=CAM_ASM_000457 /TAXON_ID=3047 /ORGANISM="Dunaliella tertiolecta, Strain CCMP1320" /LENGTH=43 /DNA_ID= /DNA_START= /DNA_END= /DNA_ORIENTATION=